MSRSPIKTTSNPNRNCGLCHTCGTALRVVLDGEEWCDKCGDYRRYRSHGWSMAAADREPKSYSCPDRLAEYMKETSKHD